MRGAQGVSLSPPNMATICQSKPWAPTWEPQRQVVRDSGLALEKEAGSQASGLLALEEHQARGRTGD